MITQRKLLFGHRKKILLDRVTGMLVASDKLEATGLNWYTYEQTSPSTLWNIPHQQGNTQYVIDVYVKNLDGTFSKVEVDVYNTTDQEIFVDFTGTPTEGFANIMFLGPDVIPDSP